MRKLTLALAAVLAAACGSSSNGSAAKGPTGTIGGKAFAPAEVSAVSAGPATCQVADPTGATPGTVPVNTAAIAVTFGSFTGICTDFTSPFCTTHKSAEEVTLLLAGLNFVGGTAKVAAGTYTLTTNITQPTFDLGTGTATLAYAASLATNDTCMPTGDGSGAAVAQGTLRVDALDATHVAGHVDLTFSDGGKLAGDFSAPLCSTAPDICALATSEGACAGTPVCK